MKYIELVDVYEKLESTTKRLEKTFIISEFIKKTPWGDLHEIILLLQGRVFPSWDEQKIGVASRLILKAINTATGISASKIENEWKKTGDLGIVAENLVKEKKQSTLVQQSLTVDKVFTNLQKLAGLEGAGTVNKKMQLISELLTSAKPKEAKYIVRTILEELRVGVAAGTLRDSIVWANFGDKFKLRYDEKEKTMEIGDREKYNEFSEIVQKAYDMTNDFSVVAEKARGKISGLEKLDIVVGKPIKVMLAQKVKDVKEGFERCLKPCDVEYKLDGFRIQAHKKGKEIILFTRRLENVTKQFPDIAEYIMKNVKGESFIIDSEAVGYDPKTERYLPFQSISQRIKRKYDIAEMAMKFPVEVNVFDIVYYNGRSLIDDDFEKRRSLIKKIVANKKRNIVVVKNIVTSDEDKVERFYKESLREGNEGIMIKKLKAPYKPGSRVGFMVKLKPVMETLDLVIVAAEWGEGKRAHWLSSFTVACIDDEGNFLEIGKFGTGIKEKAEEGVSFEELTKLLKPLVIAEKGKEARLKPKIVVELTYEEIQKSPTYSSGFALRFPRLLRLRLDRGSSEVNNLEEVKDLYNRQRHNK